MVTVRGAQPADVPEVVSLLERYMAELFKRRFGGTAETLLRDAFGGRFSILVAESAGEVVGFAAVGPAYDLHYCVQGGDLIDLYVVPERRGHGVAALLVTAACSAVRAEGGCYLAGLQVGEASTRAFYERVAMIFPGASVIVGGRAFRVLADLAGKPARTVLRALPASEWNSEPWPAPQRRGA